MQISPCLVYRLSLLCVKVYGILETFIYALMQIILSSGRESRMSNNLHIEIQQKLLIQFMGCMEMCMFALM
jgi:hypothetical protein